MREDLDHLPEDKQRNARYIADVLRDEFEQVRGFANGKKKHCRIMLIVLFGSYARGTWVDDPGNGFFSDYDVLVVLNNPDLVDEYRIWHTAEERIMMRLGAPVNILVHTLAEINEWLAQGHYFFRDIREEGIRLYRFGGAELAEPGDLSPAEARAVAEKHFAQWFDSAISRFEGYRFYRQKGYLNDAAFDLHQTTERLLACILLVFTNYLPKTHNIKQLNSLAVLQAEQLGKVFPQDSRFGRRCFELLKRAYIEARYSEHYRITDEELAWLEERVQDLVVLTESLCKRRIEGR